MEDKTSHELLMRMNKELQKEQSSKTLQENLQECSVPPFNSHIISESPCSHSNISFLSDGPDVCSDVEDFSENNISEGQVYNVPNKGFYDDSLSKPTGLLLDSLDSEPSSCASLGPPSSCSRPLLGCCITPAFSLTEAQQELKMLQQQLGESEPSWPSPPCGM
ncbi:PREDICTED: myomegalin-like [Thamnophis sirtalis]|uniref:Myomegalin-like n=1 Tax=Thamnophis sirtalis TaxID=35019 RepID=A0A6I9Z5J7_9SAUR|nr:PREDICTED: myomegalin-like [Thamnophis sirtalis]